MSAPAGPLLFASLLVGTPFALMGATRGFLTEVGIALGIYGAVGLGCAIARRAKRGRERRRGRTSA
jgi:hypothetical protein